MFCEQDRAILCSDCDMAIHSANEHTQKHDRFLLSGIKLSSAATLYSSSTCNLPAFDSLSNLNFVAAVLLPWCSFRVSTFLYLSGSLTPSLLVFNVSARHDSNSVREGFSKLRAIPVVVF
ncbi:B-box zinc finger protein 21 [Senna tora]|uniref:B-box zinc finger protein 21 n=1 Tax=Senna tora TaxID=362788 RepID=A0A834XC04_9FABA|nr:B-box zinc finger protein 21 [Senna tora]